MKNLKNLNFDDVDFSKYSKQISEFEKNFSSLKSDKIFMWKFNRYKRKKYKEELKFTYNSNIHNQNFESIEIKKSKTLTRKETYDSEVSFFSGDQKEVLPFS